MITIQVPGYGPHVCGRMRAPTRKWFPPFGIASALPSWQATVFNDVNSIREAAKSLHPIYATIGNVLGNDKYGDCACVAPLKIQAILDCAAGKEYRAPTLEDALWLYSQVTTPPFDPTTGANDNGSVMETVLDFWIKHGLYSDGTGKIKAAYAVDASKPEEVKAALQATGLLYVGCELPTAWPNMVKQGGVWDVEGDPNPEMGHATFWYGNNLTGVFDSTWGEEVTITWPAVAKYFSAPTGEAYAIVA